MKKVFFTIFTALTVYFLLPPPIGSMAALKEQDRAILEGNDRNLLNNPGFEGRAVGWIKTGSSTLTMETAAPAAGKVSGKWNPSATGEFLRSELIPIPEGLKNRSCSLVFDYKWSSGVSGEIKANVDDGTDDLATVDLDPSTDYRQSPPLMFTCPASGSIRVELESTADAAEISLDSFELGKLKTIQVSQAELYSVAEFGGNCQWAVSSGTPTFPSGDGSCTTTVRGAGTIITDGTGPRPGLQINNLPPGHYEFELQSTALWTNDNNTHRLFWALNGSTKAVAVHSGPPGAANDRDTINVKFDQVLTTTSNVTLEAYISDTGGFLYSLGGYESAPTFITVRRYPLNPAEAITLETSGAFVESTIGSNSANLVITVGTTTNNVPQNGTWTLFNYGTIAAKIPCSGGNVATGTTCSSGNEVAGITFDAPTAGNWEVCAQLNHAQSVGGSNGQSAQYSYYLRRVTLDGASEIERGRGQARFENNYDNSPSGDSNTFSRELCDVFKLPAGESRIELGYDTSITSTSMSAFLTAAFAGDSGGLRFKARNLDQQFPTPVFTDLQNSLNSKIEADSALTQKICAGRVIGSTGTISGTTPMALDCVGSVNKAGTGNYNVTFSPAFAAPPACSVAANTNPLRGNMQSTPSASTASFYITDASGTVVDSNFDFICIGQK